MSAIRTLFLATDSLDIFLFCSSVLLILDRTIRWRVARMRCTDVSISFRSIHLLILNFRSAWARPSFQRLIFQLFTFFEIFTSRFGIKIINSLIHSNALAYVRSVWMCVSFFFIVFWFVYNTHRKIFIFNFDKSPLPIYRNRLPRKCEHARMKRWIFRTHLFKPYGLDLVQSKIIEILFRLRWYESM